MGLESNMFECDSTTVQRKIKYFYIHFKENAALI